MKEGESSFLGEVRKKAGKIAKATIFAAGLAAAGGAEAQEVGPSTLDNKPSLYDQMMAEQAEKQAAWEKEKAEKKTKENEIAHARLEARGAAQRAAREAAPDEARFEEMIAANAETFLNETVQTFIESCKGDSTQEYIRDKKGLVYATFSEGRNEGAFKAQRFSEVRNEGLRMEAVRIATAKKFLSVLEGTASVPSSITRQWANAIDQLNRIVKEGRL